MVAKYSDIYPRGGSSQTIIALYPLLNILNILAFSVSNYSTADFNEPTNCTPITRRF